MPGCKALIWPSKSPKRLALIAVLRGEVLIPRTAQSILSWLLPVLAVSSLRVFPQVWALLLARCQLGIQSLHNLLTHY